MGESILNTNTNSPYDISTLLNEKFNDLIFILNNKYEFNYINEPVFLKNLALSNKDLIDRIIFSFIHPDDYKQVENLCKIIFKKGAGIEELRFRGTNGYIWYEIKGQRLIDNSGKKIIFIARDVSKYKKTEEILTLKNVFLEKTLREITTTSPELRFWKLLYPQKVVSSVQKTREMLESIIDNIPELIYWKDLDLVYIGCNENYSLINGFQNPASVMGKLDENLPWAKNKLDSILESEQRVIQNGIPEYHVNEFWILPNGKEVLYEINRIPLYDPDGNIIGLLATFADITERKLAEQKIKESEKKYRELLENLNAGYFEVDLKGKFTFSNDSFCEISGYLRDELIGNSYKNFMDEQTYNETYKNFNNVYKSGIGLNDQLFEFIKNDGEKIIIETSVYLRFNSEGKKVGFNGLIRDINEKFILEQKLKVSEEKLQKLNKELELKVSERTKELAESEEKFRTIAEQSILGIGIFQKGLIKYANAALSHIVGYTIKEMKEWPEYKYSKVFHPDDLDVLENILEKRREGKPVDINNSSLQFITKFGDTKWIEMFAKIIIYQGKEALLAVIFDNTEKKTAEDKLKESESKLREQNIELMKLDELKNNFITMAAHELKTPLISIGGYTDYILTKYDNLDFEIRDDLSRVKSNVKRLETYIEQLVDVITIDAERMDINPEKRNISEIIKESISELSFQINKKNLIILPINNDLYLNVDYKRIFQVFYNLISNAIKFTPEGGTIEISTEQKKEFVLFKVKDSGIGLTKDQIDHLFGKFVMFGKDPSAFNAGSGLGLYIAKGIIEAHGGEIWVKSYGKNEGSEFYFSLPIINN